MTGRALSDAQLAAALRAHVGHAPTGLRERIAEQVSATPQARRLPWLLGLGDANPAVRRRGALLLVAATLLVSIAVAAIAGALRESQEQKIDLTRGTKADAFVLALYERVTTELPALRLVLRDMTGDTTYYYDGDGILREEVNGLPSLFGDDFTAYQQELDGGTVWVVSEVPAEPALQRLLQMLWSGPTNCVTGWETIETIELIGRMTRHVRCSVPDVEFGVQERHLWIDVEAGLPLRTGTPSFQVDENGSSVPLGLAFRDVVELEIGPQPQELFALDEAMSQAEFECATTGVCPSTGPAEPTPPGSVPPAGPVVTPPPAPGPAVAPADIDAFVGAVHQAYSAGMPVELRIAPAAGPFGGWGFVRWQRDGLGGYRAVFANPNEDGSEVVWLLAEGRTYEEDPAGDKPWREWDGWSAPLHPPTFGLPTACGVGWTYLGDDLVLGRRAAHIACGLQEFWIDREWLLVTRAHDHDPLLGEDPAAGLSEVTSVTFGPQPAELFVPPSPDEVWR